MKHRIKRSNHKIERNKQLKT